MACRTRLSTIFPHLIIGAEYNRRIHFDCSKCWTEGKVGRAHYINNSPDGKRKGQFNCNVYKQQHHASAIMLFLFFLSISVSVVDFP